MNDHDHDHDQGHAHDHHLSTTSMGDRDMFKVVMILAQGLILPFLLWLGVQVVEQRETMARLEERLANQLSMAEDRYTASQAAADRRTQSQIDQQQTLEIGRLRALIENTRENMQGMRREMGSRP